MSTYFSESGRSESVKNVSYYDLLAEWYDLFFDDPAGSMESDGNWLHGILAQYNAHTVLDASCGTGRQSLPLVQRGYQVVAADPSTEMLRQAKLRATAASFRLCFHQATFEELPATVTREFDVVIALGNGLAHLPSLAQIEDALRALRRCCREDGLCLIGIKNFDRIRVERPRFRAHAIRGRRTDRTILFEVWEYVDPLLEATTFVVSESASGPSMLSASTQEYMLTSDDLTRLAREAGFRGIEKLDRLGEATYALQA